MLQWVFISSFFLVHNTFLHLTVLHWIVTLQCSTVHVFPLSCNIVISLLLLLTVACIYFCSDVERTIVGNEYLDDQNYDENNLWINELALFLFTVGFLTLAYVVLRLIKKDK